MAKKIKWLNIVLLFIVIIAFVFGIKYFFFNKPNIIDSKLVVEKYGQYSFIKLNDSWIFDYKLNGEIYTIPLMYNPNQIETMPNNGVVSKDITSKDLIYITFDPGLTPRSVISGVEMAKVFGQAEYGILKKVVKSSVTYDAKIPIITCANATEKTGVILMRLGETSSISKELGCVILTAKDETDMMKLSNKMVYIALGIMK
jgi:hypothetical protein